MTEEQKKSIEKTAQGILDARAAFPDDSLASLYDRSLMPSQLRKAHQANDRAVMQAYVQIAVPKLSSPAYHSSFLKYLENPQTSML